MSPVARHRFDSALLVTAQVVAWSAETRDPNWVEYVFGYGSLVNARTHAFGAVHPALLKGWRRRWCHAAHRPWAFLAVTPNASTDIFGVIAHVPADDWVALDAREINYDRTGAGDIEHPLTSATSVQHYWVPDGKHEAAEAPRPLLLSYLDTCVEGYLAIYGSDGPSRFFDTTDGWDTPVLNDRGNPIYRRHTAPDAAVCAATDDGLTRLGAQLVTRI